MKRTRWIAVLAVLAVLGSGCMVFQPAAQNDLKVTQNERNPGKNEWVITTWAMKQLKLESRPTIITAALYVDVAGTEIVCHKETLVYGYEAGRPWSVWVLQTQQGAYWIFKNVKLNALQQQTTQVEYFGSIQITQTTTVELSVDNHKIPLLFRVCPVQAANQ